MSSFSSSIIAQSGARRRAALASSSFSSRLCVFLLLLLLLLSTRRLRASCIPVSNTIQTSSHRVIFLLSLVVKACFCGTTKRLRFGEEKNADVIVIALVVVVVRRRRSLCRRVKKVVGAFEKKKKTQRGRMQSTQNAQQRGRERERGKEDPFYIF